MAVPGLRPLCALLVLLFAFASSATQHVASDSSPSWDLQHQQEASQNQQARQAENGSAPALAPAPALQGSRCEGKLLNNQGLVQVAYSDPATGVFLGSPSIFSLSNGTLLISHDFFPEWGRQKRTRVLASGDGGTSWRQLALVANQFWSSLFSHRGALYLLGVSGDSVNNAVAISRSDDGGRSWQQALLLRPPPGCTLGTGSVPVLLHGGRLYRGMEYWCGTSLQWPQGYHAFLISASADSNILDPAAWQATPAVQLNGSSMLPAWMPGPVSSGGFLEGNAVMLPAGTEGSGGSSRSSSSSSAVGLLLRCRVYDRQGRMYSLQQACLFHLQPPASDKQQEQQEQQRRQQQSTVGSAVQPAAQSAVQPFKRSLTANVVPAAEASFTAPTAEAAVEAAEAAESDAFISAPTAETAAAAAAVAPAVTVAAAGVLSWQGFVDMPGGGNKFAVRYDRSTGRYLALTNPSIDRYGGNADARNILVLAHSPNLRDWRIVSTLLVPNDGLGWEESLASTSYQYADWTVDGEDLVAAIRTSYAGAASFHNSNMITFKRIRQYRQYLH